MPVSVQCPGCKKKLTAKDQLVGKKVKCPACGQAIEVPSASQLPQPEPAASSLAEAPAVGRTSAQPTPPIRGTRARWPLYAGGGVGALGLAAVVVFILVSGKDRRPTDGAPSTSPPSSADARESLPRGAPSPLIPEPIVAHEPTTPTVRQLATISAHPESPPGGTRAVKDILISPDGSFFVTSGHHMLKVWSLPEGKLLKALDQEKIVNHIAISPDGKTIFTSYYDSDQIRQWSVPDGKLIGEFDSTLSGLRLNLTPDGKYLVGSSVKVELFSLSGGKLLRLLKDDKYFSSDPALSRNNKLLAIGAEDSRVKVWSLPDGQLLHNLPGHEFTPDIAGSGVLRVAFSPDGRMLASGGSDKRVILWSVPDGTLQHELREHGGWVKDLTFSHDGKVLASAAGDEMVRVWSASDWKLLHTLTGYRSEYYSARGVPLTFTPDDRILSVVGRKDITLWSMPEGKQLTRLEGHKYDIMAAQLSSDGKYLVSGDYSGSIIVWELSQAPPRKRASR